MGVDVAADKAPAMEIEHERRRCRIARFIIARTQSADRTWNVDVLNSRKAAGARRGDRKQGTQTAPRLRQNRAFDRLRHAHEATPLPVLSQLR